MSQAAPATWQEALAQGYCITSRAGRMASRIDRPDWLEHMGRAGQRPAAWADHYRRCSSQDHITVPSTWLAKLPNSGDPSAPCRYGSDPDIAKRRERKLAKKRKKADKARHATMINIYPDGSCYPNPGPGGWAFAAYAPDGSLMHEEFGGAARTTNNRMEMRAILRALKWAAGRPCVIHSDSQLCVRSLTEWAIGWERRGWRKADGSEPQNLDVLRATLALYRESQAEIRWVKGHAGNVGNERADVLAGQGRALFQQPANQAEQQLAA